MNNMSKEEKAAAKEQYYARKNKLMKLENENYTRLYALRCYDGWYKLFGHSAIILAKYISPKIDKGYNLTEDRDYNDVSEHGIVTIPPNRIDKLKNKLEKLGLKLTHETEYAITYELNERITEEDLIRMLHEDELMVERANRLVMPKERIPNLRASTKSLLETVHADIRKQDGVVRETFLYDMEEKVVRANMLVIAAARGAVKLDTCLAELNKTVEILYEYATTMADMKLIIAKRYYNLVVKIRDFEREIEQEVKRQALKRAGKTIEKSKKRKVNTNDNMREQGTEDRGAEAFDTTGEDEGSKKEETKH